MSSARPPSSVPAAEGGHVPALLVQQRRRATARGGMLTGSLSAMSAERGCMATGPLAVICHLEAERGWMPIGPPEQAAGIFHTTSNSS